MDEAERIRESIREQISLSIDSMVRRVEGEGMEISYARDIDHLYVIIGRPAPTLSFPLEDDLDSLVLYDPETFEIRGWEFPEFQLNHEKVKGTNASLDLFARLIEHSDTIYIPGGLEMKQTEQALNQLAQVV